MTFFRKIKDKTGNADAKRSEAEALHNQTKWDELERLVSDQIASPEGRSAKPSTTDTSRASQNLLADLDAADLRTASSEAISAGLTVEMPTDSEFVDVTSLTAEPSSASSENSIEAMAPSAHFKTGARAESVAASGRPNAQETGDYTAPPPPAVSRPDRADIGAMRLDVARISADIQSGEELYRRAQQRIENLTGFVERAEIDFSMLNRLEPENRRLKARNRTIEREIESNLQKMQVIRADLEDREQRLAEKTRIYETTLGKLSSTQKSLQEYERALNNSRESSDRNALNAERLQTSLDVERRENEILRERISEIVGDMEVKKNTYIEAKKIADSLAQDCADYRHHAEAAEQEADELRKSLATAQTQNNAMKAEMLGLHEDIRAFKSQSEFTIISREDEMAALQLQVDHLTKQLSIKDEIVRNAARDVQELRKVRTAQDLERERLETQIETQSYQLEQANSDLLKSKQDVTDFDRRYRDVASALSVAQTRRMSNAPSETPDIQPAPDPIAPPMPSAESRQADIEGEDEFANLTGDEVADRIMDFRLGLRKDLT